MDNEFVTRTNKRSVLFTNTDLQDQILPISLFEECIKETVIGQDEAVRSVITSMYASYYFWIPCVDLIIGGSGCGKTLLISTICKEMGLPFTIEQATQYSEEGYVGLDTSDMLAHVFSKSDNDLSIAEEGILAIDEICKKKKDDANSRDVSGEGVQNALLGILSGATVQFQLDKLSRAIPFDTKKLKIFLMGAFDGIDEIRKKRLSTGTKIGFNANVATEVDNTIPTDLSLRSTFYTNDDLIEYGLIPEFVGRIRRVHVMNPMTVETLIRILKESKESCFLRYERALFKEKNIRLKYSDALFRNIAKKVLISNTGARDLDRTVNYIFEDIIYQTCNTSSSINVIHLFDDIVDNNKRYKIYKR